MNERPLHPGRVIKKILSDKGWSQSDLAFVLGQSVPAINSLVSERRDVHAELSKALGLVLGYSPDYFAELQKAYDLACADEPDPEVKVRADMLSAYPIREMIRRGWLPDGNKDQLQAELARFFGLSEPDSIPYLAHAAKKTHYELNNIPASQLAWLFRVRHIAQSIASRPYSSQSLSAALDRLRKFTVAPEEARHVPRLLAECGVRYVIVEALPQAKIDGVCFWLNEHSPVIGMSTRFDRIDNYWFVLRHEIEHVLRGHGTEEEVVDSDLEGSKAGTGENLPPDERVANAAAADFCVPSAKLDSFLRRKHPFYYERDVLAFAKLHGIHPGIVVGQMQRRLERYDYLRKYQVKIRHCVLPNAYADGWGQSVPLGRVDR